MKTLSIECASCHNVVEKPTKEINRQRKKGREVFYCSLACAGANNVSHLKEYDNSQNLVADNRRDEYTGLREHLRRARKRTKTFDLTLEDLKSVWASQEGRCAYTGVKLEHPNNTKNYNFMASLDRINSDMGYVKDNIQFISVSCNWLKNKMNEPHIREFFQIVSGAQGFDGAR